MKKLVLVVLAAVAAVAARADTVGFTTTGGLALSGALFDTLGYTFTLAAPIQVTQLGFWDFNANGLEAAVPVTLWNSAGTVQATATVPAGTNANELNQYLYVTLTTPVTLAAGTYTLAGYVTGGDDAFQGQLTTISPAAGITYGAPRAGTGTGDPTTDAFNNPRSYFGPNFQFVVPEPSTWVLMGFGVAVSGVVALHRRRNAVQSLRPRNELRSNPALAFDSLRAAFVVPESIPLALGGQICLSRPLLPHLQKVLSDMMQDK